MKEEMASSQVMKEGAVEKTTRCPTEARQDFIHGLAKPDILILRRKVPRMAPNKGSSELIWILASQNTSLFG